MESGPQSASEGVKPTQPYLMQSAVLTQLRTYLGSSNAGAPAILGKRRSPAGLQSCVAEVMEARASENAWLKRLQKRAMVQLELSKAPPPKRRRVVARRPLGSVGPRKRPRPAAAPARKPEPLQIIGQSRSGRNRRVPGKLRPEIEPSPKPRVQARSSLVRAHPTLRAHHANRAAHL